MQGEGWVSAAPMTAAASFPPQAACPSPCTPLEALLAPGAAAGRTGGREGAAAARRVQAICTVLEAHPRSPPLRGVHQPRRGSQLGFRGFSFKLCSCFCSQPCTDLLDAPGQREGSLCSWGLWGRGSLRGRDLRARQGCRGVRGHVLVFVCLHACACACIHGHGCAHVGMCICMHARACTNIRVCACTCEHPLSSTVGSLSSPHGGVWHPTLALCSSRVAPKSA